jgi:tRNA G18 (ribose-2'-O)-methylase SpoU
MAVVEVGDPDDPRVAPYRDLRDREQRLRSGSFVAETREVVRQVLAAGRFRLRSLLTTREGLESLGPLPPDLEAFVAPLDVLKRVVGFDFHRGCVALGDRAPMQTVEDVLRARPRRLVVLDDVRNADNLGGVFRNARAFGAGGVLLSAGSLDPLYRKVVRVSMGAALIVPFARLEPWDAGLVGLHDAGMMRVALASRGGAPPDVLDTLDGPVALLVGNEGTGVRPETLAAADVRVTIPMAAGVDSLNATVACGIALHRLGAGARGGA